MKIFISHSKVNNPVVQRIIIKLDNNGIDKWVDLEQLDDDDAGRNEKINEGLATSNYFLLVWSKDADESNYVKKEYNAAISRDYDKRLSKIIIRLDDTLLPPLLADKKIHEVTEDDLEEVLDGIILKIKDSEEKIEKSKQFDDSLDAEFGEINVARHKYSASLILKTVDPKSYEEDKQDWLDRLEKDKHEK